jgi:transposase
VFAAISEQSGCMAQMYKLGAAFKGDDVCQFLETLRAKVGKHKKLAVFWDNASIHKRPAREVAPALKIEVLWNAPYRPDLNGIEFFWHRVKQVYRKEVTRLRVLDQPWDQEVLVKDCVRSIGFECAKDSAA